LKARSHAAETKGMSGIQAEVSTKLGEKEAREEKPFV